MMHASNSNSNNNNDQLAQRVQQEPDALTECLELHLRVLQGDGLVAKDRNYLGKWTSSDPYVKVTLRPRGDGGGDSNDTIVVDTLDPTATPSSGGGGGGDLFLGRSQTILKNLSPVWNADFHATIPLVDVTEDALLELALFDYDRFGDDDCMGVVPVHLAYHNHKTTASTTKWYGVPVLSASRAKGRVQCTLRVTRCRKTWSQLLEERIQGQIRVAQQEMTTQLEKSEAQQNKAEAKSSRGTTTSATTGKPKQNTFLKKAKSIHKKMGRASVTQGDDGRTNHNNNNNNNNNSRCGEINIRDIPSALSSDQGPEEAFVGSAKAFINDDNEDDEGNDEEDDDDDDDEQQESIASASSNGHTGSRPRGSRTVNGIAALSNVGHTKQQLRDESSRNRRQSTRKSSNTHRWVRRTTSRDDSSHDNTGCDESSNRLRRRSTRDGVASFATQTISGRSKSLDDSEYSDRPKSSQKIRRKSSRKAPTKTVDDSHNDDDNNHNAEDKSEGSNNTVENSTVEHSMDQENGGELVVKCLDGSTGEVINLDLLNQQLSIFDTLSELVEEDATVPESTMSSKGLPRRSMSVEGGPQVAAKTNLPPRSKSIDDTNPSQTNPSRVKRGARKSLMKIAGSTRKIAGSTRNLLFKQNSKKHGVLLDDDGDDNGEDWNGNISD